MDDLARKMHAAAAQAIVSDQRELDAKHAVAAALYELTQEYHGQGAVPLSDLRRLLAEFGQAK